MRDPIIERLDAQALDNLRYYAKNLQHNAEQVGQNARAVVFKRPFETMAEDELQKARTILESALTTVKQAQAEYQAKAPMKLLEAAE